MPDFDQEPNALDVELTTKASPSGPIASIPINAAEYAQTYYTPAHLEKIREMYRAGAPIALPAQLEGERAELDAARTAAASPASANTL